MPPGHPFHFPLFFILRFSYARFSLHFRFVVFLLFLVPPSLLFVSLPFSPLLRIMLFSFGATSTLRCLRAGMSAYSLWVLSPGVLYLVSNFVFLLFRPLFFFDLTSFVSSCLVILGILLLLSFRFPCLLCVFFTSNPSFHPSTSSSPSVRADCSSQSDTRKLCGHKPTTQRYHSVMNCHRTGNDRYGIQIPAIQMH